MLAVYAKCIFCLRKDVCYVWWKLHSIWVNSSRVKCMVKWISVQKSANFIPGPFSVNVRLPLANHIRHFCYTRQTTGITPLKSCVLWCWLLHPPVKVYTVYVGVKVGSANTSWHIDMFLHRWWVVSDELWVMSNVVRRCYVVKCCSHWLSVGMLMRCGMAQDVGLVQTACGVGLFLCLVTFWIWRSSLHVLIFTLVTVVWRVGDDAWN